MPRRYEEIGSEIDREFYGLSHAFVRAVGRVAFLLKIRGAGNVPQSGRGFIVSNHLNWSDVLFVPAAIPKRHVTVIGRRKMMEMPVAGALFKRWGALTIDRTDVGGTPAREDVTASLNVMKEPLTEERLELAFASPNTRTPGKKPGRPSSGVIRIAHETETPIIPAVIKGSDRLNEQRVTVMFGSSIGFPETPKERRDFQQHLWEVQLRMFDSIPHSDHYTDPD